MKKLKFAEIPKDWALCVVEGCQQKDDCLRHVSNVEIPRGMKEHKCVMPQACSRDGRCPMFASAEPVTLAWGMCGLLAGMGREAARRTRDDLIKLFGDRRRYYRFREGRWVMSPMMQEAVAKVMRSNGCTDAPKFDRTVQNIYFPGTTDYVFLPDDAACDTGVTMSNI